MSESLLERLSEKTLSLCKIRSEIGNERALADHVEAWAKTQFAASEIFRLSHSLVLGNLDDPRPILVLAGHLDTVPAHPQDGPPRKDGDRIFGLGASDMKGAVAVMMALFEDLPRQKLPVNLVAVLYEREEGPYLENGLGPLLENVPALGRAQLVVAMEPTDNAVHVGCVGTLHAKLRFRGKSAHSARPWQGENAIHKAGALLAELNGRSRREVQFSGHTFFEVMSATLASGGRARNVVPELFELNLNYRFAPGKSLDVAQEEVRTLVGNQADIEFTDLSPSGRVCAENAYFQKLLALTALPAEAKQAWTDVGRLSAHGIDAINFGPGETAQAHQADESCSSAALVKSYQLLSKFLS